MTADPGPTAAGAADADAAADVQVVVDAANVVGSRPDGWWRDRAGAAERLLARSARVAGAEVDVPAEGGARRGRRRVAGVHVVLEGAARAAGGPSGPPEGLLVVRARADGDSAIVELAGRLVAEPSSGGAVVLVVTADRGLRARLPREVVAVGPRWLWEVLDRVGPVGTADERPTHGGAVEE